MNNFREKHNRRMALIFLMPNLIGFLIFTLWPVVAALILSFTSWDLLTPPSWAGFENFVQLLGFHQDSGGWAANDPLFWKYLGNTIFMMLILPVNMAITLGLAMLLNNKLKGIYLYRLIYFLPSILSGVAIFYLWRWIYNVDYGLINNALSVVGIDGPDWLGSTKWAKPALMFMGTWMTVGGTSMILYLAALQNVPRELHEAAMMDGANAWQRFWAVTWPSVMPVTFFIFTMGLIYGLQGGFDAAFIMTGGGPNGATTTIGYYIYQKAFMSFEMGYASALSWVLFVLILGVTLINRRQMGNRFSS